MKKMPIHSLNEVAQPLLPNRKPEKYQLLADFYQPTDICIKKCFNCKIG